MDWKRSIVLGAAVICGGLALAGVAGAEKADTLTVAEMWEIDGLDPAKEGTFVKEKAMIAECLVNAAPDFSLQPGLATSWRQIDATTWQFDLRPGVTFHNGAKLTAACAAASLQRALDVNPSLSALTKIKAVQAIDELVLRIETVEEHPALPAALVYADTAIIHPDSATTEQGTVIEPIGTGPYRLARWQQAEHTVALDRFEAYWGPRPSIPHILFRSIPDPSTRSLEIQKGSVDLVADAPYGDLDLLRKRGLEVTIANTARAYILTFGSLKETPFADQRVRQALSQAIDRQQIVQYILFGMGKPAAGGYDESMVFANKELTPPTYDPVKAKALLAEAGWADSDGDGVLDRDGASLSTVLYTYPQRPGLKPMAMALQQQWQAIGMACEVRIMDWAAIDQVQGPGDIKLSAFASAMIPDPDYFMRRVYSTDGDSNTYGYSNQQVDALLDQAMHTADQEQRLELYRRIQGIVHEDLPVIPVSYYGVNIVTSPRVKGFVFNPVAHDYMLGTSLSLVH
jgi:peptide/nickel transport system substrate-binding protein